MILPEIEEAHQIDVLLSAELLNQLLLLGAVDLLDVFVEIIAFLADIQGLAG